MGFEPRGAAPRPRLLDGVPEWKPVVVDALLPYATRRGDYDVTDLRREAALALGSLADLDGDARDVSIRAALMNTTRTAESVARSYAVLSLGRIARRPGHGPTRGFGETQVRTLLLQETRGKTTEPWAALEELNQRAGGGEAPWNLCFGRDLDLLSCGPVLVGGRRPGLLLDLGVELRGNRFGEPEFSTMTRLKSLL